MATKTIIRYSPHPITAYAETVMGQPLGPAQSRILSRDPLAWNLAFLSHPYEHHVQHPDSNFTVLVDRTLRFRSTSGHNVAHMLMGPAPYFVKSVLSYPKNLPLYEMYGEQWLENLHLRERLCQSDPLPPEEPFGISGETRFLIDRAFRPPLV